MLVVGGGQRVVDAATDPIGNGRAMSLLFAREGAHVAVADRNDGQRRGDRRARSPRKVAARSRSKRDITTKSTIVARMVAAARDGPRRPRRPRAQRRHRRGRARPRRRRRSTTGTLTLATNLRGPMLCCREALPVLAEGSSIVFISSIAGITSGSQLPGVRRVEGRARRPHASRRAGGRAARHPSQRRRARSRRHAARPARERGTPVARPRRTSRSVDRRRRGRSPTPCSSSSPTRACT